MDPQYGGYQVTMHTYPSDHSAALPLYQVTPPTPYYPYMRRLSHRMEDDSLKSSLQPARPPASVYQQPPRMHETRFSHEYLNQSEDCGDHYGSRRSSRSKPIGLKVEKNDQGSQCSESHFRKTAEQKHSVVNSSEVNKICIVYL